MSFVGRYLANSLLAIRLPAEKGLHIRYAGLAYANTDGRMLDLVEMNEEERDHSKIFKQTGHQKEGLVELESIKSGWR